MNQTLSTDNQLRLLMDINFLNYDPSVSGSLSNSRQFKKYLFSSSGNYAAGQQPRIQINSSSDSISGPTSFILCDVTFGGTSAAWNSNGADDVKNGSAFNMLREVSLSHISGEIISRVDHLNSLVAELVAFLFDESYKKNYAPVFGYGDSTALTGETRSYALPMFLVCPLFSQRALIPAQLLAGANLKIQLETNVKALVGVLSTYTISNMSLYLDSIDLYDAVKRSLLQQAGNTAQQGLQYPYYDWFQLRKSAPSTLLNFDLNYSCAKAMTILIKPRYEKTQTELENAANSMSSSGYQFKNWRTRIGAHSMPDSEVTTAAESYVLAMEAASSYPICDLTTPKHANVGVSYTDYSSEVEGKTHGIVLQSLEQNAINHLNSGTVTNNARLLNFRSDLEPIPVVDPVVNTRVVDAYIKHLRIANVMINNIVIDK